jgi:hypothetical protein
MINAKWPKIFPTKCHLTKHTQTMAVKTVSLFDWKFFNPSNGEEAKIIDVWLQ